MKHLITLIALVLIPNLSFAAPLTQVQASSLIAVVQSSPTTPASAFTNLITSFSNITLVQAESLITVVQAAPGVPANAFVNMLIVFTVDPVIAVATIQPTPQQTPSFGSIQPVVDNTPAQPAPVVQSAPMDKSDIVVKDMGISIHPEHIIPDRRILYVSVLDKDGNYVQGASITSDTPTFSNTTTQQANDSDLPGAWGKWKTTFQFTQDVKTVTFTSGVLTKTVSI